MTQNVMLSNCNMLKRDLECFRGFWWKEPACMLSHVRLCDPLDCSPPGSSVHGILQERILEWVAISSSRGSS